MFNVALVCTRIGWSTGVVWIAKWRRESESQCRSNCETGLTPVPALLDMREPSTASVRDLKNVTCRVA
jgi:hypothetical protein